MDRTTQNLAILTAAQALYLCSFSASVTLTGIVGSWMAPIPVLATLPFALIMAGTTFATVPLSVFMARRGRRAGFILGSLSAVLGGSIAVFAIATHDFTLFCLSSVAIGIYQAVAGYYRYAAADEARPDRRGRAISTVLAGGVVAAIAGPSIAASTRDLLRAPFAGAYLIATALAALSAIALAFLRPADGVVPEERAQRAQRARSAQPAQTAQSIPPRPLRQILAQPIFILGAAGCSIAWFTMVLLMTAAPIAALHHHHSVDDGAVMIQWHLLGMYAPAFVAGRIIDRLGAMTTLCLGAATIAAGALTALTGTSHLYFVVSLGLVGAGWNITYVSGSTLVAGAYRPSERAATQASGEIATFLGATLGSLSAGVLLHLVAWRGVNIAVLSMLACCVALGVSARIRGLDREMT